MADVNANIGVNIDTSNALAQLKSLQRQLAQFHTSVAKSSSAAASAQASLQKNLVNSINATGAFSAELRTVRTTSEAFTNSLEKNKFSMREYFRYAGAATTTFGKNFKSEFDTIGKVAEDRVKKLQTQYIKLGRDSAGAMKAIAVIPNQLDLSNHSTQVQLSAQRQAIFNQLLKQGSTNLLNFGKNTQWAGRQLMVGFTLPLASLGMVASKSFMDMEAAALKFRKVYGDLLTPKAETQKALEDVQELAKEFTKYGIAVSTTVGLAAEAAAAGFQGLDLQRQTTEATRLSILGQIDTQQALGTTIALQNAFKMSSEDLADSINFLNAVENQTVVSLDDITTAIPKVAPVIQQLGGDVKDLAFFMTAMKQGGINASEGANALKSGLASLINPTNSASKMLAGMGIDINNIVNSNQGDLKATVIGFAEALDTLDPLNRARAIEQMFGKFQFARLSALFSNVIADGTQASRVLDLAGASIEELSALSESELGMTAESAMNKFKKAVEDLKVALVPVGQAFLEAVTPIIEFFGNILEKFANLSDGTKKAITVLTIAIGGIGPVALMAFGLLANGLANIIKLFATLRNGYLRLTGQSAVLGEQTQYMTNEQLEAAAAAHSLNQTHANLTQTFTAESSAVRALIAAYRDATTAAAKFAMANPGMMLPGRKVTPKKLAKGSTYVPGRGNKDTVPAVLTPGEAVIPRDVAQDPQFQPIIDAMVNGNLQGFNEGSTGVAARKEQALKRYVEIRHGAGSGEDTVASKQYKKNRNAYLETLDRIKYDEASKKYFYYNKDGILESQGTQKQILQQIKYSFHEVPNALGEMSNRPINPSSLHRFLSRIGQSGTGAPAPVIRLREKLDKFNPSLIGKEDLELAKGLQRAGLSDQQIENFMGHKEESHIIKPKDPKTKWQTGHVVSDHAGFNNYLNRAGNVSMGKMVNDPRLLLSREQGGLGLTPKQVEELKSDYRFAQTEKHPTNSREFSRIARLAALEVAMNDAGLVKVDRIYQAKAVVELSKIRTPKYYKDIAKRIIKLGQKPRPLVAPESIVVGKNEGVVTKEDDKVKRVTGQTGEAKPSGKSIVKSPSDTRVMSKDKVRKVITARGMRYTGAKDGYDDGSLSEADQKERNRKERRYSYNPEGPAPIGPQAPEGATMLPIVPPLTEKEKQAEKRKERNAKVKQSLKPFGAGSMGASMGMYAASMALSSMPQFAGKALLQSTANFAAAGALFGPWGVAAGAAIGLVAAGITNLMEKQKKYEAMTKAVFKSSSDIATFFGNTIVDTEMRVGSFSASLGVVGRSAEDLGKSFGYTNQELKTFVDLVASLPENNPLKDVVDGLANEKNPETIKKIAEAFVTTQVAIGQIKPEQAQKTLDLILAAAGHSAMVGSAFINLKTQADAIAISLKNASGNAVSLGTSLTQLTGAASNATSLEQLTAILAGIAASGITAAAALSSMYAAYLQLGNLEAAEAVQILKKVSGITAEQSVMVLTAITKGMDVVVNSSTNAKKLAEDAKKFLSNPKLWQKDAPSQSEIDTQNKKTIKSLKSEIDLLKEKKKIIDERIKQEQKISNEIDRQNQYLNDQADLDKQIVEAKIRGNYLEAATLLQEKAANTAELNQETKVLGLQSESDALGKKIELLQESNDKVVDAINQSAIATTNGAASVVAAINEMGSIRFDGKEEDGSTKSKAKPVDTSTESVQAYLDAEKPKKPGASTGRSTTREVPLVPSDIDPAQAFDDKTARDRFEEYVRYQNRKALNKLKEPDDSIVVSAEGSDKKIYKFRVTKGGEFIRISEEYPLSPDEQRAGNRGPVRRANGGMIRGAGTATSDSIPAYLSNGEYVVKADSVKKYGVGTFDALNAQKFKVGGMAGAPHQLGMGSGSGKKMNSFQKFMMGMANDGGILNEFMGLNSLYRSLAGQKKSGDTLSATLLPLGGASYVGRAANQAIRSSKASATILKNLQGKSLEFAKKDNRNIPEMVLGGDGTNLSAAKVLQSEPTTDLAKAYHHYWGKAYDILSQKNDAVIKGLSKQDFLSKVASFGTDATTSNKDAPSAVSNFLKSANKAYVEAHGLSPQNALSLFKATKEAGAESLGGYFSLSSKMASSYLNNLGVKGLDSSAGLYKLDLLPEQFPGPISLGGMSDEFTTMLSPNLVSAYGGATKIGAGSRGKGPQRDNLLSDIYSIVPGAKLPKGMKPNDIKQFLQTELINKSITQGSEDYFQKMLAAGVIKPKNLLASQPVSKSVTSKIAKESEMLKYFIARGSDGDITMLDQIMAATIKGKKKDVRGQSLVAHDPFGFSTLEALFSSTGPRATKDMLGLSLMLAAKESGITKTGIGLLASADRSMYSEMLVKSLEKRGLGNVIGLPERDGFPTLGDSATKALKARDKQLELLSGDEDMWKIAFEVPELALNASREALSNLLKTGYDQSQFKELLKIFKKSVKGKEGFAMGGLAKLPKFHDWNGPVPGTYGQELPAILKSGTEGIYQEGYINDLKQAASSTTNSDSTMVNVTMNISGAGDPKQVAEMVMKQMEVVMNKNNKSNAGLR